MAKTDYQSIDEYQNTLQEETKERLQSIRKAIHEIVPDVEEVISYQIPCFKFKGYLIYYSAYARHISLSYPYSKELLAKFESELKDLSVSKSAIQFPNNKPLPLDLIKGIVSFRVQENIQNEVAKSKKKK
ncbi:iron chaperone [Emticicia sp. C21]|uniref:iron chaperone n=1 Tax=Emticicia sp. C21 TaxID=2302915 RepID=UPI000E340C3B|nr:DUF1801 domain-containing protein [Emticicia sp. C21]RFS14582.1 DUF1801 domain-containing protein [Emticicia sp. C21]